MMMTHAERRRGLFVLILLLQAAAVLAVPPVAKAGPPLIVPLTGALASATVTLDGSASYDPDGTISAWRWYYAGAQIATGPVVDVTLPLGVAPVALIVTDNAGSVGTDVVVVAAARALLHETFDAPVIGAEGWQPVAGTWQAETGAVVATDAATAALLLWNGAGAAAWNNYSVQATFQPLAEGTIGMVFHAVDASNHYRFAIENAETVRLERVSNGVATTLAAAGASLSVTQAETFVVSVTNGLIVVKCGVRNVLDRFVTNTTFTAGSVGCWAQTAGTAVFEQITVFLPSRPVRIVPVGDSITQGRGTVVKTYSWRYPLYNLFLNDNLPVDTLGSLKIGFNGDPPWTNYYGNPFDRDHEGHWGWTPANISNYIAGWMAAYPAAGDIVLLLLGTNASSEPNAIQLAVDSHRYMIETARRNKPHVVIIIGLPFQEWAPFPAMRQAYNDLAAEMSRPWSPVVTVDHSRGWVSNPGFPGTHTVDWVHPNTTGDYKLALNWFGSIVPWVPHALHDPGMPQNASLLINGGDPETESTNAMLTLFAEAPTPDCMLLSESPAFVGATWTTYAPTSTFVLSDGVGPKTVYARFNAGGPISATVSNTITIVPEPVVTGMVALLLAIGRRP